MDNPRIAGRIRKKDPETLRAVIRAYLAQVLRAARAAGLDSSNAEEVTQATFTTFLEKAAQFKGKSHVRTWLFGILYNKIAEARRQLARVRQADDIDEVMEQRFDASGRWTRPPQSVETQLYGTEVRQHIETCLDTVPQQQRMAFVLREVQGLSTEEIRDVLDVTSTNLGVLLYRSRNRLRECLEKRGVER